MAKRLLTILVLTLLALLPWTAHTGTAATTYEITRISLAPNGTGSNGDSDSPDVSGDGRYIAFVSAASNLVDGDTNGAIDVFVYDRQADETTRIAAISEELRDGHSHRPALSADGRYLAFASAVSNLVIGDTNSMRDVFVYDQQTDTITRVSVATDGTQGNGDSVVPALSADGRYVAFASEANTLVTGDTNDSMDVFVHDRQTGETIRVSVATDGTQGSGYSSFPALSADGRYVAFHSTANDLVDNDTDSVYFSQDVFVHDRQTGETTMVSVATDGTQGNLDSRVPALSGDGRYVVFESWASTLVPGDTNFADDIFLHDRETGTTTRISVASDGTQGSGPRALHPDISADGRWITFWSQFDNLVPGDTNNQADIFLYDGQTEQIIRLTNANANSTYWPVLSADGLVVAFVSNASNLVTEDTDNFHDIFLCTEAASYSVFLPLTVRGD